VTLGLVSLSACGRLGFEELALDQDPGRGFGPGSRSGADGGAFLARDGGTAERADASMDDGSAVAADGAPDSQDGGTAPDAGLTDAGCCRTDRTAEALGVAIWGYPGGRQVIGDELFFVGIGADGRELWKTDGTAAGTQQVADINATGDSDPTNFVVADGVLFFSADDGVNGRELWRSDGTEAGTRLVHDINPSGSGLTVAATYATAGAPGSERVCFVANDGSSGEEPWVSDGTSEGTSRLADLAPGGGYSRPTQMYDFGELVLFNATTPDTGVELFRTDGTPGGTQITKDANPGTGSSLNLGWWRYFTTMDGAVYFRGRNDTNGLELWRTDGTADGTVMVADVIPGADSGVYHSPHMATIGDQVWFRALDPAAGFEIFVSDGTSAGTRMLTDLNPSGDSLPRDYASYFFEHDGLVYFRADDGTTGMELFASDGSAAGTTLVRDIHPSSFSDPKSFFVLGGALHFIADDGVHGREIWVTDGTEAGTRLALELRPGVDTPGAYRVATLPGVAFVASDGGDGYELFAVR
jgi:ELWxxDGT repeat protein